MDHHGLQEKRALVCGATQGIGKAAAIELAGRGAAVTLFARNLKALETVRAELSGSGHSVLAADFHDNEAVLKRTAAANVHERGPVHVLVNNTGGPPAGPILDAGPDAFVSASGRTWSTTSISHQVVLPGMKDAGYGRIVNIVSTSVREPIPGMGVSNTVRAAVAGWAETLAGEVARFGVTVNKRALRGTRRPGGWTR
jgi:3-oxoacyl-[acyl-carrier protein] reductase